MRLFKLLIFIISLLSIISFTILSNINKEYVIEYINKELSLNIDFKDFKIKFLDGFGIYLKEVTYKNNDIDIYVNKMGLNLMFENGVGIDNLKIQSLTLNNPIINVTSSNQKDNELKYEVNYLDIKNIFIKDAVLKFDKVEFNNLSGILSFDKVGNLHIEKLIIKEFYGIEDINITGDISKILTNPSFDIKIFTDKTRILKLLSNFSFDRNKYKLENLQDKTMESVINIKGDKSKFFIKDSIIKLNDTQISFSTVLKDFDFNNIVFFINIDKINLDDYLNYHHKSNSETNYLDIYLKIKSYLKKLKLYSSINIDELVIKKKVLSNIYLNTKIQNNIILINPLKLIVLDGNMKGEYKIDFNFDKPKILINQVIDNFNVENIFDKKVITGKVNLLSKFSFEGVSKDEILKSLKGLKFLNGKNLTFHLYDVDSILKQYSKTKDINIIDIGAVAILGPMGGILSQTIKFGILYDKMQSKGNTTIEQFNSLWEIKNSLASAKDVAIKTKENLIALNGNIDLNLMSLKNVELALVDSKGCPKFIQTIDGNLLNNKFTPKINYVENFLAPVESIFKSLNKCKVFYHGRLLN